jgi:phage terminase large subunit GpA-like protein
MGESARLIAAEESRFVRDTFDKNSAADYISKALNREISGEAMRQLNNRKTCVASGKLSDGRLFWSRRVLDAYIRRQRLLAADFFLSQLQE